jgi:hypothetical protein
MKRSSFKIRFGWLFRHQIIIKKENFMLIYLSFLDYHYSSLTSSATSSATSSDGYSSDF